MIEDDLDGPDSENIIMNFQIPQSETEKKSDDNSDEKRGYRDEKEDHPGVPDSSTNPKSGDLEKLSLDRLPIDDEETGEQLEKLSDKELSAADPNLVVWDGDDQEDMSKISNARKWTITLLLTLCAFKVTSLSSIWSTSMASIEEHFHSSPVVGTLGITLFIVGLGCGPLFLSPLSEFYGRKIIYCLGFAFFVVFQFPTAFGNNMATLLVGRFLAAFSGSAFMSVVPGTFTDIYEKNKITIPMAVYTCGPFIGPGFGPLIGGFINEHLGFRWTFYIMLMWSGVLLVLLVTLVPETFPPKLLHYKAKRLRKTTGNQELYAAFERNKKSVLVAIVTSCQRPFMLLSREPALMVLCFYTGFVLALVYLFFVAFPLVFANVYGFSIQFVGLSFMGLSVGMSIGGATAPLWNRYHRGLVSKNGGVSVPEFRIPQAIVGAFLIPIGLFMFAWTIYPSVHWIVPEIACAIFGIGCLFILTGLLSYIAEAYRPYAASATAANVFVRSMMAGAFPLFGRQMYEGMGYHWATTLQALVAVALIPFAFIFYKYGHILRQRSRYAVTA